MLAKRIWQKRFEGKLNSICRTPRCSTEMCILMKSADTLPPASRLLLCLGQAPQDGGNLRLAWRAAFLSPIRTRWGRWLGGTVQVLFMKQGCRDKQLDTDQKQEESADVIADLLGAGKSSACKPESKRREDAEEYPHIRNLALPLRAKRIKSQWRMAYSTRPEIT